MFTLDAGNLSVSRFRSMDGFSAWAETLESDVYFIPIRGDVVNAALIEAIRADIAPMSEERMKQVVAKLSDFGTVKVAASPVE